jgi:shikimate kinase
LPQMTDEIVSHPSSTGVPTLRAVSLVGFMGAGKTTVGRALAARLGWRFEDLDDVIQAREGRTIEQIFQQQGESAFRNLEHLTVREVLMTADSAPLVLALGGGAFVETPVRRALRDANIPAVFLDAEVEELFQRSEQPEVVRPLRQDRDRFSQLYERRRPAYLKADLRIETGGKAIDVVLEEIISGLHLIPKSGACE